MPADRARRTTRRLLKMSREKSITPRQAAVRIAETQLAKMGRAAKAELYSLKCKQGEYTKQI